jgi:glycosyltransferase involved in cell wall biosynthesis
MRAFPGRPLSVVHLTLGLEMGGQEKLLVAFARHHDRKRFRLEVVVLGPRGLLADEIESWDVPVTALDEPEGLRPDLVFKLAAFFRRRRTAILHTHDERPHIYGTPAAWLAGVGRVIQTRHSMGVRLTQRQARVVNLLARLTDRFICVSRDGAQRARAAGIGSGKVGLIWNGIDLGLFRYSGGQPGGPAVTVARINPEKDIANFVRAAALVARADGAFRAEVAGEGPCLPEVRRLVAEAQVESTVRFLGLVRDVPGLLGRSGMFVLPSLNEGISLTLLEAMAVGLPVVATCVGGTPEVVEDGVSGLLVPPGDPEALAAAILRLRRDSALARRLGEAGRRRVEQHFDVVRMVRAYEQLYRL